MDAALDAAMALLLRASALAIGIVLLAAAFHKLRGWMAFRASVEGYRLLPDAAAAVVAALLPVLEALAGVALIVDGLRIAGAWLAFATIVSQPFESFSLFGEAPKVGWLALWPLLSALASLAALAAAFALGSRGLMGLCVLAALLHVSHFYYAMGASLLVKSVVMLLMGAACLLAARRLRKA